MTFVSKGVTGLMRTGRCRVRFAEPCIRVLKTLVDGAIEGM